MPDAVRVVSHSEMFASYEYGFESKLSLLDKIKEGFTDWMANAPTTDDPVIPTLPKVKCVSGWVGTATSNNSATVTVSGTYYWGEPGDVEPGDAFPTSTCAGKCSVVGDKINLPPSADVKIYAVGTHRVDTDHHTASFETSGGVRTKNAKYVPFVR